MPARTPWLAGHATSVSSTAWSAHRRSPLNDRLDDLLYQLRRSGRRVTKTDLIEMTLWELPAAVGPDLLARIDRFRHAAGER